MVNIGQGDSPLPPKKTLEGRLEILEQPLVAIRNTEAKIVMQPELVGYIYGTISPPNSGDAEHLSLSVDPSTKGISARVHLHPGTHEFVVRPFRAGPVRLIVANANDTAHFATSSVSTDVRAGEVTNLDIVAPTQQPKQLRHPDRCYLASMAHQRDDRRHRLTGNVQLADGKPALGAQALYFEPGQSGPTIVAMADALGKLRPRGMWRSLKCSAVWNQTPGPR